MVVVSIGASIYHKTRHLVFVPVQAAARVQVFIPSLWLSCICPQLEGLGKQVSSAGQTHLGCHFPAAC